MQGDWEEVQETLDSSHGLFTLIVTDSEGQKIFAASKHSSALAPEEYLNHDSKYDRLLNPPPIKAEWRYEGPGAVEPIPTEEVNEGKTIGRVYYVRNAPPSFRSELGRFLIDPLKQDEQFAIYRLSMGASVGAGFLLWVLLEFYFYQRRVRDREAEARERAIEEQNQIQVSQFEDQVRELSRLVEAREREIEEMRNSQLLLLNRQREAVNYADTLRQQVEDLKLQLSLAKKEI